MTRQQKLTLRRGDATADHTLPKGIKASACNTSRTIFSRCVDFATSRGSRGNQIAIWKWTEREI
jgi:hypothetical protein